MHVGIQAGRTWQPISVSPQRPNRLRVPFLIPHPAYYHRHQSGPSEDSDYYLEYNGADTDTGPQAIYCNLPSQHPCTRQEDDEDYVVPGR